MLEAALALLTEGGPGALSLREVARRAGVSHAAPYRHFETRAALLVALAEHGFGELSAALSGASSLLEVARAYVRFAREQPQRFRLMFDAAAASAVRQSAERALARLRQPDEQVWTAVHGIAVLAADRWLDAELGDQLLARSLTPDRSGTRSRQRS